MTIHQDHGYDVPELSSFYVGLVVKEGAVFAQTVCVYNGKKVMAENGLSATVDMLLFSCDQMGERLDRGTEIKPLIDLVFASLVQKNAFDCALYQSCADKEREALLHHGLEKLEASGLLPDGTVARVTEILDENKELWPQDILPLLRLFPRSRERLPNPSHSP